MREKTNNKRYWIKCSCGGHAICIEREDENLIDMAFWSEHLNYWEMNLSDRIKASLRVLRRKNLYADMVILYDEDRKKLIEVLQDI